MARIARAAAVAAGVVLLLLGVTATPAGAHFASITASIDCDDVVTFTSRAWEGPTPESRTNPAIGISYSTSGPDGPWVNLPSKSTYRFGPDNGFEFTDSFPLPAGADSVVVRATALAPWGTGAPPRESQQTSVIAVPPCPDNPPAASGEVDCAAGGVAVNLVNPTTAPVSFDVAKDGVPVHTGVAVPAGGQTTVVVPLEEDFTARLTVSGGGQVVLDRSFTRDCEPPPVAPPRARAELVCAEGGVVIDLMNPGAQTALFDVYRDATLVHDDVAVPPDGVVARLVPMEEGQTVRIVAVSGNETVYGRQFTRECEDTPPPPPVPTATGEVDCAEDGVVVTLVNSGDEPVTVDVSRDGTVVHDDHSTPPGTSTVVVPMDEDTTSTVTVTSGTTTILEEEFTRDCEETPPPPPPPPVTPVAAGELDCVEGGVVVTVSNPGDVATTVDVLRDGTVVRPELPVPPGEERAVVVPMDEDTTSRVTVTSGTTSVLDEEFTRDCVQGEVVERPRPPAQVGPPPATPTEVAERTEVRGAAESLPVTGADTGWLAMIGGFVLAAGLALVAGARRLTPAFRPVPAGTAPVAGAPTAGRSVPAGRRSYVDHKTPGQAHSP